MSMTANDGRTHWEGCHLVHLDCAIRRIQALEAERERGGELMGAIHYCEVCEGAGPSEWGIRHTSGCSVAPSGKACAQQCAALEAQLAEAPAQPAIGVREVRRLCNWIERSDAILGNNPIRTMAREILARLSAPSDAKGADDAQA